jgi:hypothetical protein
MAAPRPRGGPAVPAIRPAVDLPQVAQEQPLPQRWALWVPALVPVLPDGIPG